MSIELDTLEQRIIGVLIEKELTVPDAYPLTVNALVAGCNQKSNRDPMMTVEDYDVEGALRSLMDKAWVTRREGHSSRVMRYAHEAGTQLGVGKPDLAILCELLCRGPQAPGALKTRCGRMHAFSSPDEVEARLAELSLRPVPYVLELERRPRERQARWEHCLGKASSPTHSPSHADADGHAPAPAPAPTPAPAPAPTPAPALAPTAEDLNLEARVDALEQLVLELTDRLDRLEGR
jgi:uncharacterized protein YceH (UPF0502 family)